MASKRKRKPKRRKRIEFDVLKQIRPNAAGIDVGATEMYVCVPPERATERVRSFGTFTPELQSLVAWLKACGVTTVAMESTGVYWIPLFDMLQQAGIEALLVNARHLKNVSGRKTDVSDCEWLYQLHTYGLLQGSYHPPEDVRSARELVRHRGMLVKYRAAHIQHMQKALEQMNLKLTHVLSDITGVTGMEIIRAIVAGERDPMVLAAFRRRGCKRSETEIAAALTGNYRAEHLFTLEQSLALYNIYGAQIDEVDVELERIFQDISDPPSGSEGTPTTTAPQDRQRQKRRKNQAKTELQQTLYEFAGVDLAQIDGIDTLTAQVLLTEIGPDVSAWPTAKHFASWLGLSPNNRITGGKVVGRRTRKTSSRAATALRIAAQALARSQSALGAFYRRIRARHGAPKAVTATAHKLARIVYHMLKHKVDYHDPGPDAYNEQQRQRAIRRLKRQAAKLGLQMSPAQPAPMPAAA